MFLQLSCSFSMVGHQGWSWGAGFCFCQACLGAAQVHGIGHNAQSPALSCMLPAAGLSLQSAGRSRLDSIKNGFLLGAHCYFYSLPSCFGAITAVQSSCSAHLLGNTHPAWCCQTSQLCPPPQRFSPVTHPQEVPATWALPWRVTPELPSSFLFTRNGTGCRWEDLQAGPETYR